MTDHNGAPVLPTATRESGNTTESSAPRSTSRNDGTLLTGWDHSQGSTPPKAKTSQNSSVESLPQPQKPTKDQQTPRHGNGKISIRDRIQHLTWAWFTTTMSTGGLALALGQTPHRFRGLDTIGTAVFILDLVLFLLLVGAITTRFAVSPRGALKASLTDPTEAFFFPTFMLSISTIISNTQIYGQPHAASWLPAALRVVFWLYTALALLVAILLYLTLFTTPRVHATCTPAAAAPNWVLPVFPAMLCGTLSGLLAPHQDDPAAALSMIVAGVSLQGLGWLVFCFVASLFLQRLFCAGLLPRDARPAMFMMVGPPSFTALALVANAKALPEAHAYFAVDHPGAIRDGLVVLATWTAVFLWSLAFWFFGLAVAACAMGAGRGARWTPTWWAYVFPNVGFTVATVDLGEELGSEAILWVGSAMTVLLVVMWLFVAGCQVRAVVNGMVLWPGRDEDRDEPQVKEGEKRC
ncbi:hypothetical protein SLS55_008396 [Diplodia seriata]|uniref:Malic acid transport protein n=1 Tax=Diplodia seriata TaxID=420778 RepID=A0ABR3CAC4_9PEZI